MKNFIMTAAAILGLAILPLRAESACNLRTLQGSYVAMLAGEFSGFWQRCNATIDSTGLAQAVAWHLRATVGPIDPVQFTLRQNCFVTGQTVSTGFYRFTLRFQPHKRGLIGRFVFDNGVDFFDGPVVAVKRGK